MSLGSYAVRDLQVTATARDVIRHVRRKLKASSLGRGKRTERHALLRDALKAHARHRKLCRRFALLGAS
jgi:hypothetical protein